MSKVRFSLSLSTTMNSLLIFIAKEKGTSKSKLINDACWKYVEEFEAKHGKIEVDKKHYGNIIRNNQYRR